MMHGITEVCATESDSGTITIGLILLRKLFNADPSPFDQADPEIRASVKSRMLEILGNCVGGAQRGSAAGCVSALAVKIYAVKENWSELWENIFSIISSPESPCNMKIVSCEIISSTCTVMTDYFKSHVDKLAQSLNVCFLCKEENHITLKETAFDVVMKLSALGMSKPLSPLVPLMMGVIQDCLNAEDWDSAERLTSAVADGIASSVDLFSSCTVPLLSSLMQVCSSPPVGRGARHMAIEALLTYCESDPKTVRKVPDFSTSFFELLFQYTLQPEYPESWDVTEMHNDEQDLEEDLDQVIGSAGLDRLSIALGGRKLHMIAQQLFMQNITSSDWRHRNGAVLLICYVAEGMSSVLKKTLPALVSSIIPSISDEVKYVRANALDCISQLCTDFSPEFELQLHSQVLPPVIAALRDPIPHVAACAAKCLDCFFDAIICEDDEEEDNVDPKILGMFQPYVERVCVDCVALLQSSQHVFVQESALGALSSLTSTCKNLLAPYTEELVKVYQQILALPDSEEAMNMKCKTIECVTLLACGVGKEVFAPYTRDVCDFLSSLSSGGLRTDDPRSRFVFRGWTCMVECLGQDVLPYMQQVVPALLYMMNVDCDAQIEDADVGDDADNQDDGFERCRIVIPGKGEKVAKFHTSMIEDKELASNIVNAVVQELGMSLQPFFTEIVNGAIKLLSFNLNFSIRENGALILGAILEACMSTQHREIAAEVASAMFGPLIEALEGESDMDAMDSFVQILSHCVGANPAIIGNDQNSRMVCEKVLGTLQGLLGNRDSCLAKIAEEQDEDELDNLHDENEELENNIRSITDLVSSLLQHASATFTPIFMEMLLPAVNAWLSPETDDFMVGRGLVVLCDFVEYSANFVGSALEQIVTVALSFSKTRTDPDVLQSDFFLISLLAQYVGQHHASTPSGIAFAQEAQMVLAGYFSAAKEESYNHCTTNALSAYVMLLQSFPAALEPVAVQMLETITAHLPAKDDDIEATRIHDRVLQWIVQKNPIVTAIPGCSDAMLARIKAAEEQYLSEAARQQLTAM